jgi:hypothetical protein
MLTLQQALEAREFHEDGCTKTIGPRGGQTLRQYVWRRNGRTQTWRTRPGEFRIPVKFGMRSYDYITDREAPRFHTPEDCPLNR